MIRRTWVLLAATVLLGGTALFSALPARASHPRDVAPTAINPTDLALPISVLPPSTSACLTGTLDGYGYISGGALSVNLQTSGALACGMVTDFLPATSTAAGTITVNGTTYEINAGVTLDGTAEIDSLDHSAVSDNADANGTTTPPDGYKSQLRIIHQNGYDVLQRITGYRMDFHYFLSANLTGTEYLASIYPSAAAAQAAMDDATKSPALITIIGMPLTNPCNVGDACLAFSGPNPGTTNKAVLAIFRHGPIVVETATQVPAASFATLEPTLETVLYGLLKSADAQIQHALNPQAPTNTPAPTATSQPAATATATPTSLPPPLTLSVSLHSSVKAGKKQQISVSTAPEADVAITVQFPNKSKKTNSGTADSSGSYTWKFTQPKGKTSGSNHQARVTVTVTDASGATQKTSKKYKIT